MVKLMNYFETNLSNGDTGLDPSHVRKQTGDFGKFHGSLISLELLGYY